MKRSLCGLVFVLVILALLLSGCGGSKDAGSGNASSSGSGSDTAAGTGSASGDQAASSGDSSQVVITNDSANKVIDLKVGQKVVVKLDQKHTWEIVVTPDMIVGPVADGKAPDGAQGLFEAKFNGKATLQATGQPTCLKENPPCKENTAQFNVSFTVSP